MKNCQKLREKIFAVTEKCKESWESILKQIEAYAKIDLGLRKTL